MKPVCEWFQGASEGYQCIIGNPPPVVAGLLLDGTKKRGVLCGVDSSQINLRSLELSGQTQANIA